MVYNYYIIFLEDVPMLFCTDESIDSCPFHIQVFMHKGLFVKQWTEYLKGKLDGEYKLVGVSKEEFNRLLYIYELVS